MFLLIVCLEPLEGHLDSFPHEELNELLLADMPVSVDIYLAEDVTDGLL